MVVCSGGAQAGVELGKAFGRAHVHPAAVMAGAGDLAGGHPGAEQRGELGRLVGGDAGEEGGVVGADAREGQALAAAVVDHVAARQQAEVAGRVQKSIIAFQFYDKLSQRLAHVSHSLEALSGLVTDQRKLYNPFEWVALQEKIRAKYSTREELDMFNAVMQGMPVKEALDQYKAEMKDKGDDVELF